MFVEIFLKVLGKVPTISINKTEGCQVYLSKDSLHCDIVSAKSSEMNILVPQDNDEFVSVGDNPVNILSLLQTCICKIGIFCSTERVSSTRTIQDCLGRLQTGDRAH